MPENLPDHNTTAEETEIAEVFCTLHLPINSQSLSGSDGHRPSLHPDENL